MKKALVTGSHGFLGSHLVSRLEQLNYQVIRGDREGNVPEPVDLLIDCASYGNLWGQDDQELITKVNIDRVIKLFGSKMYKQAIYTSSSSVSMNQTTPYAESKRIGETIANYWGATIIRPYTIYGIGDNPKHLIPTAFRSCLKQEPMRLEPSSTHDYIWIDDLVDLYLDPPRKLVEAGTGIATTNGEVVGLIQRVSGKIANILDFKSESRSYDSLDWKAPEAIKENMVSLVEGLKRIYDHEQGFEA